MRWLLRVVVVALIVAQLVGCALLRLRPTPTPVPTPRESTPLPPTTQPTTEPIAGFSLFAGTGIELWLPDTYRGGDLSEDLDTLVADLNELGYSQVAEIIQAKPEMFVLWTFDSAIGSSGYVSSATATTQNALSAFTLDAYVDAANKQYPADFVVSEVEVVDHAPFEARRMVVTNDSLGTKQLQYIYKLDARMWAVTYSTSQDEFEERLPSFELSASTFRVTD